jgi:diguanylate cyclase (GGDEF)-like protein/PAS domain S-box-containing protein
MAIKPLNKSCRHIPVVLIILVGIFFAVVAQKAVRTLELNNIKADFSGVAQNHFNALEKEIEKHLEVLRGLHSLFISFEYLSREQFRQYTSDNLSRHPDVQALEWIPRVPHSQRALYEKNAQDYGFQDFQITELGEHNLPVRAGIKDEYFPVYYVEPHAGNEVSLGYDLSSDPTRLQALIKSRDSGLMTATSRIILVQEKEQKYGFLVFVPVYRQRTVVDTIDKRRNNLLGFTLGVFRIEEIVEKLIRSMESKGVELYLLDTSNGNEKNLLYHQMAMSIINESTSKKQPHNLETGLLQSKIIDVADRQWKIIARPSPLFFSESISWYPWFVFFSVLLLFGMISGLVYIRIEHAHQIGNILIDLSEHEERFRSIAEHVKEVFWLFDWDKQQVLYVNPAYEEIWGRSVQNLLDNYNEWEDSIYPDDRIYAKESFRKITETGGGEPREYRIIRPDGSVRWVSDRGYAILGKDGNVSRIVGVAKDITDLKKTEEVLIAASLRDDLTGLYNRRGFFTLAEQQCKIADRTNRSIALLYFDLDNMKSINDEFGHIEGDRALVDIANILTKTFRKSDIITRMGGDEFVVLITEPAGNNIESFFSRHIHDNLKSHNESEGRLYNLSLSMGMSHYCPEHPCSIGNLIKVADAQMLRGKKHHKLSKPTRPLKERMTGIRKYKRVKAGKKCFAVVDGVSAQVRYIGLGGIGLQPSQMLLADKDHRTVNISWLNEKITVKSMDVWSSVKKSYPETGKNSTHYEIGLKFIELSESEKTFLESMIFKLSS